MKKYNSAKHDIYLEDTLSISSNSSVQRSATSAVLQVGITSGIKQHLGCISSCIPGGQVQ